MTQAKQYRRLGKFELHELIGEGAMGVVWKAYDSVLRRYVALKLLPAKVSRTGDIRERFLREARAAGVLQHSNIVTIYDLGEAENQLFIAMELVDGRDLSTIISGHDPLPLERKLDIVIEVLEALTYAHNRGVIHRDIKPSNVRIATDGGIKIMDFGIARLQSAEFTGSGAIDCSRAIPKSMILMPPSVAMRTFDGLMSRWITPRLWAYVSASSTSITISSLRSSGSGSCSVMIALRSRPSTRSLAMKSWASGSPKS